MTLVASAPGKLVLTGEYVVLEGAPALVAAMNRRARVALTPATDFAVTAATIDAQAHAFSVDPEGGITWAEGATAADGRWGLFAAVLQAAHRACGGRLSPCHLDLDTTAFTLTPGGPKLGLGSSAALSIALLGSLLVHGGQLEPAAIAGEASRAELLTLAHAAHQAAQGGAGSGVDLAASLYGGVVRFERPPHGAPARVAAVRPLAEVHLLPIWSGAAASTANLVAQVMRLKAEQPLTYWEVAEKLGALAHAAAEFWTLGKAAAFFTIVDAYVSELERLGSHSGAAIVTAAHRDLAAQVRAVGAHYKSSGAGGGDLGLAFCPSVAVLERLKTRLKAAGLTALPLSIDFEGLRISR